MNKKKTQTQTETNRKNQKRKFYNLKIMNNNFNIVSKTLILGAHEAISCAPE